MMPPPRQISPGRTPPTGRGDGGDRFVETHFDAFVVERGHGARDILLAIAGLHRAAERAAQRQAIHPVQLLCDKADGHQARMIVPLCDHQYVVGHVFIHHVPRIFAAVFQAADAQPFALAVV